LTALAELFISYDLPYEYTIRDDNRGKILKMINNEINNFDYFGTKSDENINESPLTEIVEISDLESLIAKLELYSRRTEDIICDHLSYLFKNKNVY
jgi:hypothetical protein